MKPTVKDIIWAFILGMVCFYFLTKKETTPRDKVIVTEEEKEVFTPVHEDEDINKSPTTETKSFNIDSLRAVVSKQIEFKYKDSISLLNALIEKEIELKEANKIRQYPDSIENDLYKVNFLNIVRGHLIERQFKIKLKPQKITYLEKTTTIEKVPKFSLWIGGGLQSNLIKTYLPLEISIQTKNRDLWDFSYSIDPVDIKKSMVGLTFKKIIFTKY